MTLHADTAGGDPPPGGRVTLRQLRVLVEGLPPDSALHRAIRGHNWQDLEYLLAEAADAARYLLTYTVAINSKNPNSVKRPDPLPRPVNAEEEERKAVEDAQLHDAYKAMLAAMTPDHAY